MPTVAHSENERLRLVFALSPLPVAFSPLGAALLSLVLRPHAPVRTLVVWNVGLVLLSAGRLVLAGAFRRTTEPTPARWALAFLGSMSLVALWWGVGVALLLPALPFEARVVAFAFVTLMSGGAAASYAAYPRAVVCSVPALAVPSTVVFACSGELRGEVLALASVLALVAAMRSAALLQRFFTRAQALELELQHEKEKAERLARLDMLTAMPNRRAFHELGGEVLARAERLERPLSVVMLDVDHFKRINDRFGHATGDVALQVLADVLRSLHRASDVCGRLGGEEFALVLPDTRREAALALGERLRSALAGCTLRHRGVAVPMTVSVGVVERARHEPFGPLLARADAALYEAKRAGRNRVVAA